MSAVAAFARKERDEILHTWRLWVLPGLLLFFGLTSPVIAVLLPRLAEYAAGEAPGTVIEVPPPTAVDAYVQFIGNLQQIGSLAAVIIGAGVVAAEVRNGTAALTLAKPLGRGPYVLIKATAHYALTVVAALTGTAACIAVTAVVFDPGPLDRVAGAVGCWLLLAALLIAIATLLSTVLRSQIAAAVSAAALTILVGALSQISLIADYSPVGLWAAGGVLLLGKSAPLFVPVVSCIAATAIVLTGAVAVFRRREI